MRRWCEIYFDGRFHQRRSGTGVARLVRIDPGGQQSGNSRRHLPLAPDLRIQVKFRNIFFKEKLYIYAYWRRVGLCSDDDVLKLTLVPTPAASKQLRYKQDTASNW